MYRLLIVDTPDGCDAVRGLIDWHGVGFTVILTASSCAEAVRAALERRPHVVLIGLDPGPAQGLKLADQLRELGLRPILAFLSGSREPERIIRAMRAGGRDYFLRPVSAEDLEAFALRAAQELGGVPRPEASVDPVLDRPYAEFSRITNRILLQVRTGYHQSLTLSAIAEGMHMSGKYIGRVFLRDTGLRFSEYLMAYRMQEARRLLLSTGEKISVIAGMVGYVQLNSFYIHFRRCYGLSPGTVRERMDREA